MSKAGSIEKMHPALLENSLQEVGDLIGDSLGLDSEAFDQGALEEIYLPRKKKTAVAGFRIKGEDSDQVHLFMDLDGAIELAGKLIMLPPDEVKASQKKAKLDGEMEDAFSEIANIITGVINSTWHDCLPEKKLHFVKGSLSVFGPKDKGPQMPEGRQSVFSGSIVLNDKPLGTIQFFFPHSLIAEPAAESAENQPDDQPESRANKAGQQESGGDGIQAEAPAPEPEPEPPGDVPGHMMDQQAVDDLLIQVLDPAAEELGALLGDLVSFEDCQAGIRKKEDLLSRTRGKQVLTKIRGTGDREGLGFMLLPLKDAVYFGGLLLMMPAESITQIVKQGKFEGEVADAFGEIANILVGCYSNEFKAGLPFNLKLQKDLVETLVPAQVDPAAAEPFALDSYYMVSARIRMGDKTYGPLELLFPPEILGLTVNKQAESRKPAEDGTVKPDRSVQNDAQKSDKGQKQDKGQKAGSGQKSDTDLEAGENGDRKAGPQRAQARIISVIGGDPDQLQLVEESISEEDVALASYPMDSDFKQEFGRENPDCVFLFINRVNDQGLSKAIKVRSALGKSCPLIVGGPQWTKSLVLKARKYGASDILVTPADKDVIRKKYRKYL